MSRKQSPRYGLTIDTGTATPTGNRSTLSPSNAAKSPSSHRSSRDDLRDAIDIIDQFQETTPCIAKSSRHKRDDHGIKDGPGNNKQVNTSNAGEVETVYRPRFFNYEPAAPSPRSNTESKAIADNGPVVKESKKSQSLTSPQSQASPRAKTTSHDKNKSPKTTPTSTQSHRSSPRHNKQTTPNSNSKPNSTPAVANIPSSLSDSNHDTIIPSTSSASFKTTSQLQKIMRTPEELVLRKKKEPKQPIPLNVVCTEDGGFEVHESGRVLERGRVYRVKNSVKYGLKGILPDSSIAIKESVEEQSCIGADELGENGWHRLLDAWSEEAGQKKKKHSSFSSEAAATLDQLSAIRILQHSLSAYDEYDALREERSCLLHEMRALEKDRLCLERMFHEIEKEIEASDPQSGQRVGSKKHALNWDYKDFKENIRRIERDDRKYLPLIWLEELAIMENAFIDDGVGAKRNGKRRTTHKIYADDIFSKEMVEKIRDERGNGLALLFSDMNAKNSLIGRCYMNSLGKERSNNRILSMEGPSIIIPNGGIGVRYFGVTGSQTNLSSDETAAATEDGDMGTSYFIKFDTGKSYHRRMLPANLLDRLEREDRDSRSLRYLSTGPPSVNANPYYAEFDDGECWWGTSSSQSQEDDELHQIFMTTDVHRVAFGIDSWIVISKDGGVVWKNIPQDLHDVMSSRDSTSMAAPCDVSLGIGGSYFIRFLDGSVEYSLPSFVADVCERLNAKSQIVCNVSLNVNTYDCLIRYTSKKTN
ncbi:hypothetical protein ACHAXN_006143 [Cyclotella atomus]